MACQIGTCDIWMKNSVLQLLSTKNRMPISQLGYVCQGLKLGTFFFGPPDINTETLRMFSFVCQHRPQQISWLGIHKQTDA